MSISVLAFIIVLGFVVLVALPLVLRLGGGRRPSHRTARSTSADGGHGSFFDGPSSDAGGSDCGGFDGGGGDCSGGSDGGGGGGD